MKLTPRNLMIGAGGAAAVGVGYSMYQHRKAQEGIDYSVFKAQERTAVNTVTPPTIERSEIRSKLQGNSTADNEITNKLKGARDYTIGTIETSVKDAAKSAKDSETKSKLSEAADYAKGYRDRAIGAVETTAKDTVQSIKHASDEARHKNTDLSERLSGKKEEMKHKFDRDAAYIEGKAKDVSHKAQDSIHKGLDKVEYGAQKAKNEIVSGAQEAKTAVVHGAEVAMDKTKEVASDLAKKAEQVKDVTIQKTEELAEKSKEVSKDFMNKAVKTADATVSMAKDVGAVTAAKGKEAFLKTGHAAESVVKPVAGAVVDVSEQVGEKYEQAKENLYDIVKDARDKAALKKAEADAKRNLKNSAVTEKEIENVNDVQRY